MLLRKEEKGNRRIELKRDAHEILKTSNKNRRGRIKSDLTIPGDSVPRRSYWLQYDTRNI